MLGPNKRAAQFSALIRADRDRVAEVLGKQQTVRAGIAFSRPGAMDDQRVPLRQAVDQLFVRHHAPSPAIAASLKGNSGSLP